MTRRTPVRPSAGSKVRGLSIHGGSAVADGRLEKRTLAAFRQAVDDGRLDVAEHLLRALEVLGPDAAPGSPLAEAYL
jgi:hypothetical protein